MTTSSLTAYLAPEGFLSELEKELTSIHSIHGQLIIARGPRQKSIWSQCIAEHFEIKTISSIGEAAKILRQAGKFWAPYSHTSHRRVQLIQEQLFKVPTKPLIFLGKTVREPCGLWTLLDAQTLAYSAQTSSALPLGRVQFAENKDLPPSRAYLKLWELFTLYGVQPEKGQRVIDFGSCPGGWTWVLQQMGCHVLSIDKALLAPQIQKLPRVEFKKCDAFSLKPEDLGPVDWFFSDIICYPPKLFELVQLWKQKDLCHRFVCTIKFQGETDLKTMERFEKELGARLIHLFHNKHEVTALIL